MNNIKYDNIINIYFEKGNYFMETRVIMDLLNPVRIKIVQIVLQKGVTTSKELSELLPDIAIASLYRHIKRLIELDVLEIVTETPIRGTVERSFKVKENPNLIIEKTMKEGDSNQHFHMFYSFLISQLMDFSDYLNTPYDMYEDMVGFRTSSLYLNKDECKMFYSDLAQVVQKYSNFEHSKDRNLMKFSVSTMPVKNIK